MRDLPSRRTVSLGVARSLSEPAQQAVFEPPARPDTPERFEKITLKSGLRLACSSRVLYQGSSFFANGEPLDLPKDGAALRLMKRFANERRITGSELACWSGRTILMPTLYEMYLAGWISYD
jgi:ribosomal protein L16 Arg81 hydroxylase